MLLVGGFMTYKEESELMGCAHFLLGIILLVLISGAIHLALGCLLLDDCPATEQKVEEIPRI